MDGSTALVIVLLVVAWLGLRSGAATSGRASAGRMVAVRAHSHGGGRATIARHEAGHAVAARALGGRVRSAEMDDHSGLVQAVLPTDDPGAAITFLRAGQYAAGTNRGAGADDDEVRRILRKEVPAVDRAAVRKAAERRARQIVRSRKGQIRRDAKTLGEKGRL